MILVILLAMQLTNVQCEILYDPTVSLLSYEINNITTLELITIFQNGGNSPLAIGDELSVAFDFSYTNSRQIFEGGQSKFPFYTPFPSNIKYTVTGKSGCEANNIKVVNDAQSKQDVFTFQVAATNGTTCTFSIYPFLNPFSKVDGLFKVQHKRNGIQTKCQQDKCTKYTKVFEQYQKYDSPTAILLNGRIQRPTVGTTDGSIQFQFKRGKDFPKYGGRLKFTLPTWVDTTELVFKNGSSASVCTSNDLEKSLESPTEEKYWEFIFRTTLNDKDTITLTCTNYKNPTYPSISRNFTLTVLDNESANRVIFTYPDFFVDGNSLQPSLIEQNIRKYYILDNQNQSPIPIQTKIDFILQFAIPFPLQDGDCYLKVKFPKDIPLQQPVSFYAADFSIFGENPNGQVNSSDLSQTKMDDLLPEFDQKKLFNQYLPFNDGNYFVLKGCKTKITEGTSVSFKMSKISTPQSKKTTETFIFELYKQFNQDTYKLDKQILSATTTIAQSDLIPGQIAQANFKASVPYIQTPAIHTISFLLKNNLPIKTRDFDSNILIKMPINMTITKENNDIIKGKETDPAIKVIDSYMKVTAKDITRYKDATGCSVRTCYLIRHQNFQEVKGNSVIQFQITGTTNQLSNTPAGAFEISTQIEELGVSTQNNFYSIDNGIFDSNFTSAIGGISGVSKSPMTSSSYTTWDQQNVVYTIFFQLGNYIPKNGAIKVTIPIDVDFVQSPNTSFVSKEFQFSKYNGDENGTFIAVAKDFVPAGPYSLQFGGMRNPRSLRPTDPFIMASFDNNFYKIGKGVLDNIRMLAVGTFSDLNITQANLTNGVQTDYTVAMSSPIPFQDGDIFYLNFPKQIQIPKEPICIVQNCIKQISCSSEKTRIIATFTQLNDQCNQSNANISYTIKNVINAANTIPTETFSASWTSNLYQQVGQYSGIPYNLSLTNKIPGELKKSQIINEQSNKDFAVRNEYSFRVRPTNPIPSLGVIEIIYPNNVKLDDSDDEFYKNCKAQTTTAFIGNTVCKLDRASRTILIYNVFLELQQSTTLSQFTVSFFMTNPEDNFEQSQENLTQDQIQQQLYDRSFHINTYTLNPPKESAYVTGGYLSSDGKAYVNEIIPKMTIAELKNKKLLYQIDSYKNNDMVAQLKCNAPCFTCLDTNPNYCSSCWGKEAKKDYKNYFLQKNGDISTCKASCDDGFTTNGIIKNPNTQKMYYECTSCDVMCNTCKGQGLIDPITQIQDIGKDKDRSICITCSNDFPFLKEEDNSCVVTCGTGYYQKEEKNINKCGTCNNEKCQSCQTSPDYCMSCRQEFFVPQDYRDISQIEEYVQNQAALVQNIRLKTKSKTVILNFEQRTQIQKAFSGNIQISYFMDGQVYNGTGGINTALGLQKVDGLINIDSDTTYREMYRNLTKLYVNPLHSLDSANHQCLEKCPPGFTDVSGICLPCQSPCQNCRGQVTRCEICRHDIDQKYIYGTACYEICPKGTAPDDDAFECKGCDAGCAQCEPKDTKICIECDDPLYLHKAKCLSVCPTNFRPAFFGRTCEPEATLPIIYFPFWILALLMLSISIAGKFSSKNVSGQHRVFLSFYCWIGVLDIIQLWVLVIICLIQGQIWHIIFPVCGLVTNYVINHKYKKLMEELDPPKPKFEDRLDLEEVKLVNNCDINFDKWNTKYLTASKNIRRCTIYVSHKFFQFPFTHFFGYLHCTLRTQDYYSIWEWRDVDVKQYQKGYFSQNKIQDQKFLFVGKLVPKNARGLDEIMMRTEEEALEVKEELENDKLLEGGEIIEPAQSLGSKLLLAASRSGSGNIGALAALKKELKKEIDKKIEDTYAKKRLMSMFKTLSKLDKNQLNPFEYVQHPASYPRKYWQKVPDLRVRDLYKWQMKIDFIFIRLPVIIGNIIVICASLLGTDVNQHLIQEIEAILFSVVIIFAQIYLSKTWEEQRLPEKMKDNKANYLFRQKRSPNEVNKAFGKYDDDEDIMPEWGKYLPFYKFNEIFLDNKLEELLNIFGRRQCKSCVDFPTGWEKEEDLRRTNSWPLTRVAEENYLRRGDEFNLIDFQLQNNVYADTAEPTIMFESVARDFSEFGVQVFQFDILNALGRKGGDLLNPSIDQEQQGFYKKNQKKKRGRKNKYYKQIDQEDDEEANQISDETENDGLDHVKEEDEEDEEEELIKKRKAEEAILTQERRKREEEERKKKEIEEEQKRKAQEEEAKKKAQEEAKRKAKEEEEKKKQKEEELRLIAEEEARKSAEALKLKKEKELREKEQKDYEDRIARELLEAQRKQAAEEEALKQQIVRDHSPTKNLDQDFGKVKVQQDALNLYKDKNKKGIIEAPPNLESRKFNECDIIGDLDRDEKGNVIPLAQAEDQFVDKQGRPTNQRGYLVDKNGNLVNNLDGSTMFPQDQLDERGEVPAPFNLEKYNFNPHHVRGDFDFDRNGKPVVITKKLTGATASPGQTEITLDKRSSKVTTRGFRIDQHGNMIDNYGRKKFDKSHMTPDGDLPKMFNYNGRRFDINDCIGQLDKDANGEIIPQTDRNGNLVDNLGRRINRKGYLIDEQGNVIDREGRQIFEKKHLKDDEIPKIFPFTKFNLKNILGDFEMDPLGNPMLSKNQKGQLIDSQGRVVNQKGYLIDEHGNVINKNGKKMFGKELLDAEGDIPKVFRTGLLKSDTASSLSRLMSEIEKNQLSDFDQEERRIQEEIENQLRRPKGNSGNTSVDSMMEDTPANYNAENQRFDTNKRGGLPPNIQNASGSEEEQSGTEEDEMNGGMMGMTGMTNKTGQQVAFELKKKKKKKKKKKPKPVEYEDPSLRDHLMAGAYGGVAKPKVKRPGVKYTTNIDAGLREIITPGSAFRRDPSNRVGLTINRSQVSDVGSQLGSRIGKRGGQEGTSQLLDPQQREAQLKAQQLEEIRKRKIARAKQLKAEGKIGKISKDVDFEKMFGKDIDEFLEDSEWDIESIDKMSQFSKGSKVSVRSASQTNKLKGLEKVYLQRIEPAGPQKAMRQTGTVGQQQKVVKKANFRGDGDNESVNSRNPKNPAGNRKKAWDTQSRTSNVSLVRR